jgi:hypothetical protein
MLIQICDTPGTIKSKTATTRETSAMQGFTKNCEGQHEGNHWCEDTFPNKTFLSILGEYVHSGCHKLINLNYLDFDDFDFDGTIKHQLPTGSLC